MQDPVHHPYLHHEKVHGYLSEGLREARDCQCQEGLWVSGRYYPGGRGYSDLVPCLRMAEYLPLTH